MTAHVVEKEGLFQVEGDPTEGALLVAATKGSLLLQDGLPRFSTVRFHSF